VKISCFLFVLSILNTSKLEVVVVLVVLLQCSVVFLCFFFLNFAIEEHTIVIFRRCITLVQVLGMQSLLVILGKVLVSSTMAVVPVYLLTLHLLQILLREWECLTILVWNTANFPSRLTPVRHLGLIHHWQVLREACSPGSPWECLHH